MIILDEKDVESLVILCDETDFHTDVMQRIV